MPSPYVLTPSPPPLAGESAWALAAAVVAGRAGLGTKLVALRKLYGAVAEQDIWEFAPKRYP